MANQSQLIRTTVRDPKQEKARLARMTATAFSNYQAFVAEMIDLTGEATGLASSRWAIGEQKNYKIAPGGPRNLDLCDNSIARGTLPASSSEMNASQNGGGLDGQLAQLGGLKDSRFSQSSSIENAPQTGSNISMPSKANSRTSSLSASAQSFTPRSLTAPPSSGGGVSLVSVSFLVLFFMFIADCIIKTPTAVVKDVAAKNVNAQQMWEQLLLADYQKRMGKFEQAAPIEANTAGNENVSIGSPEPSVISKTNSMVEEKSVIEDGSVTEEKSINIPVVTKTGASALSDISSSHSEAISAAPSIMQEDKLSAILVKVQAEKGAKRASMPATSTPTASVSAHSIASVAASSIVTVATPHAAPIASHPVASVGASIGPSMMRENEFREMLLKELQERTLKRNSIMDSVPTVNKEDLKVNIQQAKSDFSHPQTRNSTQEKATSKANNIPGRKSGKLDRPSTSSIFNGHSQLSAEFPIMEKLIFATQTNNSNATMSNKPLIPAPINKWTTSKLTQGKSLSKADEDFQTFITNRTAAARTQQQTVTKPLSPNPTSTKPTQAEVNTNKRKLAAGPADVDGLLTRGFAATPVSPPTKLLINKTKPQGVEQKSDVKVFAIPEASLKDRQAILVELKAASKDFGTTTPVNKENVINSNSFDEKVIGATNTGNNKPLNITGNLAVVMGEPPQDKISHVAVHSFTPNEKKDGIHQNTQINSPFNDKLLNKNQANSLVSSPAFWSISSVSDIDIGDKMDNTVVDPKFKEGVRVTATQDANMILTDWDGSWCAPPVWEERGPFDADYIPSYIKEWSTVVSPVQPVTTTVDTSAEGFVSGEDLVNNLILSKAPKHEATIPDTLRSSNERKRLNQTAGQEAAAYLKKVAKAQKAQEHREAANHAYQQELMEIEPEPNPFAPKIEIYLRPATETDVKQILQIYNHYIAESYIPEDQEPLIESDILFLIEITKQQKLPFVVAVKGRIPTQSKNPKVRMKVPQYENIVGFGYTEMRGCGIAGKSSGRSRYTHNMHFYVHQDYTRRCVGSCVLDRLLKVSSRAWSGHDGYDWLNFNNDPAYEHGCGARCHQMLIEVPVLAKNDPNYEWMKNFLRKFWFMEEFRLRCVGRTSIAQRAGEWLDVVHFQKELEHEAEFTPFI
ncbi:hypothetical protein DSL72_007751 [Monilinia vaccinii-corymbosi]|uniref:N-acetyltransferase domain-containing protein n=1 Tax=Monilinia vaccinii-corymbosi TaxID=61207 RepID=A0A8A3PII3_9HELO|nr:hypothetical protein DSL72_007751 [Monilinia vaccinii-corymbosi]